jgi:PTS system fructose-specific IIA component/PTS system nitrogen regulatory IIA component
LLWFSALTGEDGFDFFVDNGTIHELDVANKEGAMEALVCKLSDAGYLPNQAIGPVVSALLHREELGSTGIGRGIAVPHAKHESCRGIVGIIGYVPNGVDFGSLDGEPVKKICLVVSSPKRPGDQLRALERISRKLRSAS